MFTLVKFGANECSMACSEGPARSSRNERSSDECGELAALDARFVQRAVGGPRAVQLRAVPPTGGPRDRSLGPRVPLAPRAHSLHLLRMSLGDILFALTDCCIECVSLFISIRVQPLPADRDVLDFRTARSQYRGYAALIIVITSSFFYFL